MHLRHSTKKSIHAQPASNLPPKAGASPGKTEAGGAGKPPQEAFAEPAGPGTPCSRHSLRPDVQVVVAGVAHLTEAGDKEVVAAVIRWGVLFDVGKLHELGEKKEGVSPEGTTTKIFLKFLSKPANVHGLQQCNTGLVTTAARRALGMTSQADQLHPGHRVPKWERAIVLSHRAPAAPRPRCGCCKPHCKPQWSL